MISYDEFKTCLLKMPNSSEFELYFTNTTETYAIIKYADTISFQRCGYSKEMIEEYKLDTDYIGSGEHYYSSIDELAKTDLIDGILLLRDWEKISDIVVNNTFSLNNGIEEIAEVYFK